MTTRPGADPEAAIAYAAYPLFAVPAEKAS
ncbi:MAG: hypothetical protein QOH97_3491 [Actinoplanes sp.]|nr:hypothetical protein [Actinoplanes sp.]